MARSGGGIGFKGIRIGGSGGSAEINVTVCVVDTMAGQVKASKSVVGKSGKKGLALGYHGSALGGLTGDLDGFEKAPGKFLELYKKVQYAKAAAPPPCRPRNYKSLICRDR